MGTKKAECPTFTAKGPMALLVTLGHLSARGAEINIPAVYVREKGFNARFDIKKTFMSLNASMVLFFYLYNGFADFLKKSMFFVKKCCMGIRKLYF